MSNEKRPPHPATVQRKDTPFGMPKALPPHPATVVQPRVAPSTSAFRLPHPATLGSSPSRGPAQPKPSNVAQRTSQTQGHGFNSMVPENCPRKVKEVHFSYMPEKRPTQLHISFCDSATPEQKETRENTTWYFFDTRNGRWTIEGENMHIDNKVLKSYMRDAIIWAEKEEAAYLKKNDLRGILQNELTLHAEKAQKEKDEINRSGAGGASTSYTPHPEDFPKPPSASKTEKKTEEKSAAGPRAAPTPSNKWASLLKKS